MEKRNILFGIMMIISVLLGATSCVKEVEFNGEETAPLPVLNCVVSDGDTVVYADLSKSLFFLRRGDFAVIRDAEVTLTCNGTEYPMTLVNDSVYCLRHTFASGDVVSISATMPEYGTITSEVMTVPAKPKFVQARYDYTEYMSREDDINSITLKFENNAPQNSYYQIMMSIRTRPEEYNSSWWNWEIEGYENLKCNDSRILFSNTDFPSINEGQYLLFPAKNFTGDTISLTIEIDPPKHIGDWTFHCVELFSISESLYKYISTANNYFDSRENPFTEPVQVYTNINGGLGVFGTKSHTPQKVTY